MTKERKEEIAVGLLAIAVLLWFFFHTHARPGQQAEASAPELPPAPALGGILPLPIGGGGCCNSCGTPPFPACVVSVTQLPNTAAQIAALAQTSDQAIVAAGNALLEKIASLEPGTINIEGP